MNEIKLTTRELPDSIDKAKPNNDDYVPPNIGGCWICNRKYAPMKFSMEFDTYYHPECLEKVGVDSILEFEKGEW